LGGDGIGEFAPHFAIAPDDAGIRVRFPLAHHAHDAGRDVGKSGDVEGCAAAV